MNFSTALKLNDVDDYIAPSLECIKPVKMPTSTEKTKSITIGDDGSYTVTNESGEKYSLSKAKIELSDCLACSGCITTAETILVSQHSVTTLLRMLKAPANHEIVISISPQSLTSIAVFLNSHQSPLSTSFAESGLSSGLDGVRQFCTRLLESHGVQYVLDTTWGRDISLAESIDEFIGAYSGHVNQSPQLPVLTGICPGWVCYAEKTHFKPLPTASDDNDESFLLGHLSKVRSAQQILAGALKESWNTQRCPYTVFVEPCYDRKLEATREEFTTSLGEKEADLVLGTNEFVTLLESLLRSNDSSSAPMCGNTMLENLVGDLEQPSYRHFGSGSGGYAVNVLRVAAERLFNIHLSPEVVDDPFVITRNLGNTDIQEIILFGSPEDRDSASSRTVTGRTPYRQLIGTAGPIPLLVFLVVNGFRNVQTVVQQLKRAYIRAHSMKTSLRSVATFDYVEIMACPSGCLNGGAQLKEAPLVDVSGAYLSQHPRALLTSEASKHLLGALDKYDKARRQKTTHTTYRAVPKIDIINPSSLKW